jgi:hypothetical protein
MNMMFNCQCEIVFGVYVVLPVIDDINKQHVLFLRDQRIQQKEKIKKFERKLQLFVRAVFF